MEIKDIDHLASLARIGLTDAEKEEMLEKVEGILKFIDQIQEVEVSMDASERLGVTHNVFREDANPHEDGLHTEALLAAAPESKEGYVRVKKIL